MNGKEGKSGNERTVSKLKKKFIVVVFTETPYELEAGKGGSWQRKISHQIKRNGHLSHGAHVGCLTHYIPRLSNHSSGTHYIFKG
jgi:hypothetical protein